MSPEPIVSLSPEPIVNDGSAERWAAWQERGAANDRATRRQLFIFAAFVVLSSAVVITLRFF